MIKANELRIGNLLEVSAEAVAVTSIDSESLCTTSYFDGLMGMNDCLCANANPIPLTEDWLERLGFEGRYINLPSGGYIEVNTKEGIIMPVDGASGGHTIAFPCAYVHQLQNIYFALTGEELTAKEHA